MTCTRDPRLFDRPEGQTSDQVSLHDQDEDEDRDHGRDAQCGQIAPFRVNAVVKVDDATGTVRTPPVVRTSESKNSFHEKMKARTAVATRPPLTRSDCFGMRRTGSRHRPCAASSRSRGISLKKLIKQEDRERNVHRGVDQDQPVVGIDPPESSIHEEKGKRCHDGGHHPLGEDPEGQVLAPA